MTDPLFKDKPLYTHTCDKCGEEFTSDWHLENICIPCFDKSLFHEEYNERYGDIND